MCVHDKVTRLAQNTLQTSYLKRIVRAEDRDVHVSIPTENASTRPSWREGLLLVPGSAYLSVPDDISPVESRVEMQGDVPGRLAY